PSPIGHLALVPGARHSDRQGVTMILITGASGFLGHHLVQAAVQRGHRVRALVRNPIHLVHLVPKLGLGTPGRETPVSRASHVPKRSFPEECSQTEFENEGKMQVGSVGTLTRNIEEEPGCVIHQGDITEPSTLGAALDGIESVVHAAATTSETAPDESLSWRT